MSAPRRLKIDLGDLELAMQIGVGEEVCYYLDLRSGELHLVDDELLSAVEDDEADDLPDWQREMIPIAEAVLAGDENLVAVPQVESRDAFEVMREFVGQLKDPAARQALADALDRPKPFRRFKDALCDFPALREQWFAFENQQQERQAREWLAEIGVEPIGED